MKFEFKVRVEVERTQGLFESRESIEEEIIDALEAADYGQWTGANGGEYETVDWEVGT